VSNCGELIDAVVNLFVGEDRPARDANVRAVGFLAAQRKRTQDYADVVVAQPTDYSAESSFEFGWPDESRVIHAYLDNHYFRVTGDYVAIDPGQQLADGVPVDASPDYGSARQALLKQSYVAAGPGATRSNRIAEADNEAGRWPGMKDLVLDGPIRTSGQESRQSAREDMSEHDVLPS
jgi:hypothetical protein